MGIVARRALYPPVVERQYARSAGSNPSPDSGAEPALLEIAVAPDRMVVYQVPRPRGPRRAQGATTGLVLVAPNAHDGLGAQVCGGSGGTGRHVPNLARSLARKVALGARYVRHHVLRLSCARRQCQGPSG